MLKKFLDEKKCFKLICGAGNENLQEVERLVALYAKAGCRFFDLSASEKVLKAAHKGLDFSIPKENQKDYHFCVSIGTKGDRHIQKAAINAEKCSGCNKCADICPQKAIIEINGRKSRGIKQNKIYSSIYPYVRTSDCIGCMQCQNVCEFDAISFAPYRNFCNAQAYLKLHPLLLQKKRSLLTAQCPLPACIELHAEDTGEDEVNEIWQYLNKNFDGILSLCIGRGKLDSGQIINRIKRLIRNREPYTTIIQADGIPISGNNNSYKTTLPAVKMGKLIQSANFPVYLILSGGTNSKTAELAKLYGVNFNGIAVGSYARKIVRKYTERNDFYENKAIFNEALKIAGELINTL